MQTLVRYGATRAEPNHPIHVSLTEEQVFLTCVGKQLLILSSPCTISVMRVRMIQEILLLL